MDRFRLGRYSRLNLSSQKIKQNDSEIELNGSPNPQAFSRREPSPNAPFFVSSEIVQSEERDQSLNTHWDPFFLRTWVLVAFAVFFAAVVAALQVVYSVSQTHHGIATSSDEDHYLWTYGPTAVFVVVTVLWRQVDYAAKSIQPWANMAVRPQPAKNSLLLDYVTPLQVLSFWRSVKRRHFTVSLSIAIFVLIKVITVLSTGIFSLQTVQRHDVPTSMALNNTYDGSTFQHAAAVDSRAAYVAYGHRQYNISLPIGTTDQYAVQGFAPSDGIVNGSLTYSAPVDVLSAGLSSCETGKLNYTTSFDRGSNTPVAAYYNSTVTLPGCEIIGAYLDAPDWYYQQNDTVHRFGYRASWQNVTCVNLAANDPTRFRYMIAAAYSEGAGQNDNTLLNSSNLVCIPSYSVQSAMVTLDTRGNVQSVNVTGKARELDGLSAADIADGVYSTCQQASSISDYSASSVVLDVFTTMMQQESADFTAKDLLDPAYLNSTANLVYQKVAAQVATLYLLSDSTEDPQAVVEGTVTKDESRLIARQTPIRIMQAVAAVMLLLVVIMLFIRPRGIVPRSVDSIAAVAAILARSPELEARLRGTGHKSLEELREILAPHKYQTSTGHEDGARSFSIRTLSSTGTDLANVSNQDDSILPNIKWIEPFILRRIGISLTILASIAAIIALEVLLSQSQKHNGLGSVDDGSATRYSWLYVPVLVFLLLATLFNIMDFEVEFTESFHALAKADCDARSSMLWYPLRHVSLHATYSGLKHSRFALTAASFSAILAPLLTIIVSGLFTTKPTIQGIPVGVNALDWFNTTTLVDTSTNIPLLVIEGNMSYPQWTYSELAIPKLNLVGDNVNELLGQGGSLSVDTPAIRGGVKCDVIPPDRILNTTLLSGYITSNISTPDGCGNTGFEDSPYLWLGTNIQVPVNASGFFGSSLVLGFLETCPTLALYYGHVANNEIDNFTAVLCTQYLERVQANVTFDLPDYSISIEPTTYENSAVNFSSFNTGFPTLQVLNVTSADDELDDTFNAMVYGKDGVPTNELLNDTTLIESYTHLYRQYMAQVVNIYLRADFSTLSNNASETVVNPLQASYTNPHHYRLKQSPLSTHLLAGVVGALLLCALVVFITIDMRNVLPKPIGSIAAVASLLAGSRIVDPRFGMVPPGSEYWSDEQWEKSGVWQSEMFRMGWWDKFQEPADTWQRGSQTGKSPRIGEDQLQSSSDGGRFELPGSFRIDARPKYSND
ncbi:hypothetical protein PV04_02862 [Phialophora macrospora]|uniref:Uncharacterized protein n=1 Tax=Phialophora macrospora TaxID=1851006 RepID=A0A0D2CZG5_9EURO|nr:hypothetical protein PV04_02862 [Phialophora macrospora]